MKSDKKLFLEKLFLFFFIFAFATGLIVFWQSCAVSATVLLLYTILKISMHQRKEHISDGVY